MVFLRPAKYLLEREFFPCLGIMWETKLADAIETSLGKK